MTYLETDKPWENIFYARLSLRQTFIYFLFFFLCIFIITTIFIFIYLSSKKSLHIFSILFPYFLLHHFFFIHFLPHVDQKHDILHDFFYLSYVVLFNYIFFYFFFFYSVSCVSFSSIPHILMFILFFLSIFFQCNQRGCTHTKRKKKCHHLGNLRLIFTTIYVSYFLNYYFLNALYKS